MKDLIIFLQRKQTTKRRIKEKEKTKTKQNGISSGWIIKSLQYAYEQLFHLQMTKYMPSSEIGGPVDTITIFLHADLLASNFIRLREEIEDDRSGQKNHTMEILQKNWDMSHISPLSSQLKLNGCGNICGNSTLH